MYYTVRLISLRIKIAQDCYKEVVTGEIHTVPLFWSPSQLSQLSSLTQPFLSGSLSLYLGLRLTLGKDPPNSYVQGISFLVLNSSFLILINYLVKL